MRQVISADNAKEMLLGMRQMCQGMSEGVFSKTPDVACKANVKQTAEQNVYDFMYQNYDVIAGSFRMMASATSIIADALGTDGFQIVDGVQ